MPTVARPSTFGKYQILDRIAVGGMAEIYKARLDGIGGFHRTFAIKRILPHLTAHTEFVDMLVDEAKIAGLLSHANIVQILDLGQVGGTYFIAMEYVDGPDLGKVLRRCRDKGIALPVPHAVFICIEMLKGLEYAHNRQVMRGGRLVPLKIVHRDISPANVLVSFQGEVKLTDFGIAKASVKALETASGVIKGRFNYFSSEQACGLEADQRADLFATGVLLYEMLTGRHPFAQDTSGAWRNEAETVDAIRSGVFIQPGHVNPDVPYQLELVIEQALKVDPSERFQHATAMKDTLDRFFHDAGFIFSHSTLAAFLKGLFPVEARGNEPPPMVDPAAVDEQVTRPLTASDGFSDNPGDDILDDRPTNVHAALDDRSLGTIGNADTILRQVPSMLQGLPDLSRSAAFGPIAGLGDESTLIRSNPLMDDARAWSDAETAIRPDPLREEPPTAPTPRKTPAPAPQVAARPATGAPRPVRQAPSPGSASRTFRRFQVLYLAFGAVVTVLVLLVGFLLGMRASSFTSPDPVTQVATTKRDPMIEAHVPDGAHLYVNGREIPGAARRRMFLPAGSYTIKMEMADHDPIETQIKLDDNDMRILSFQVEEVRGR